MEPEHLLCSQELSAGPCVVLTVV